MKIGGKELTYKKPNLIKAKKGKLKVKMNPGYKLKKIEIDRNSVVQRSENYRETEVETITVKNNSVIDIPGQSYVLYRKAKNGYIDKTNIAANSILRIIYVDKYSKEENEIGFYIYKPLA